MSENFQVNLDITRLYDENNPPPPVTKIGVLPFMVKDTGSSLHLEFLVMRPRAEAKHLGKPTFQLAKGTRRIHINECWCDMREDDLRHADESFWEGAVDTAIREGREEVGLKASNIEKLYDMGGFVFVSATKSVKKPLHMFAALMKSQEDFSPFEVSTLETRWMRLEEFAAQGRQDHTLIVRTILERLQSHLKGGA